MPRDTDALDKNDLDTILKVNAKSIELLSETSDQYEEAIRKLDDLSVNVGAIKTEITEVVKNDIGTISNDIVLIKMEIKEGIKQDIKEINKGQFKILLLISTGIVNLIITIVSLLANGKH